MPFTISHAAAAIPFRRTRLISSAVVAGCLVPDFEYCLPADPHGAFGHTFPGIFAFDLPIAFLFLWLFHRYAKEPLWSWMPQSFRRRVPLGPATLSIDSAARFALVVISILIGIATHLLWDAFTHNGYWPYRYFAFLGYSFVLPGLGRWPVYKLLQHGSTILGLVILWLWWRMHSRDLPPVPARDISNPSGRNRTALYLIALIALAAGIYCEITVKGRFFSDGVIARSLVTAMSVAWFAAILYGFIRVQRGIAARSA